MQADRAQLIATLEQTPQRLKDITAGLPEAALDFQPAPGEWSIREILAHLVDDEMFIVRTRVERMIKEEKPSLSSHDEKKWYSERNTMRDTLDELLHDFAIQRAASLNILALLRESEWARTAYHPEYGEFTVQGWLDHWAGHDLTHIEQIERHRDLYASHAK